MTAAIVCGMHRSGTSMVASAIEALGVQLGHPHELVPPAADNPSGFWEHHQVTSINDRLLAALGSGWDAPPTDDPGWWTADSLGGLRGEARELMSALAQYPHWGFKDPRSSIILDFWLHVIERPTVVVCVRHPLEVVASLQDRNGCSAAHALDLWFRYHQAIETTLQRFSDVPRVTTHYRSSLDRPAVELGRLAAELGLSDPPTQPAEVRIDRGLRHHRFSGADLERVRVSPHVIDLYRRLCVDAEFDDHLDEPAAGGSRTVTIDAAPQPLPTIDRARHDAIGHVDLERLAHVDLLSRYHVRGGLVSILEQRLSEAAQRIQQLESDADHRPSQHPTQSEPPAVESMSAELLSRVQDLSDRLDLALLAGGSGPDEALTAHAGQQRLWRREIEEATSPGARIGVVGPLIETPANRHINVVDGPLDQESLQLWAANGIDALWAPGTDHPENAGTRDQLARSASSLGWPIVRTGRGGTIWATAAHRCTWIDQLVDLCDDVEMRSGQPVSVLDRTDLDLETILADRVVFRETTPGVLLPHTVDMVVRQGLRSEPDVVARDLTVTIDDSDVLHTIRTDGRGRVPTVSIIVTGTHHRFVHHLAAALPTWLVGEIITDNEPEANDDGDDDGAHGVRIRSTNTNQSPGWPRVESMLDLARGEVLIVINGRRWPTRGAIAALIDALLHDSHDNHDGSPVLAVARCETRAGISMPVRTDRRWAPPTSSMWSARQRVHSAGGTVMAIGRDHWTHRARTATAEAPSASSEHTIDHLAADCADGLSRVIHEAAGISVWVADSRWISDPDDLVGLNDMSVSHPVTDVVSAT